MKILFLFTTLLASCQHANAQLLVEADDRYGDGTYTSMTNLATNADISTLHPAYLNRRFAKNAIDGKAGTDADNGWVPSVTDISGDRPVLLALSWDKPVSIDRVIIKGFQSASQNWYFTDYILASWEAEEPLKLAAPPPKFDYTDVFVGGTDSYHTYRIPAMVVSKEGTVLAFCEGRRNSASDVGDIDLLVKRSFDDGETWQEQQLIYREEGDVTIGNPVPIADLVTGQIHLVFSRNEREVFYMVSSDDGKTFTSPVNITYSVQELCSNAGFNWSKVWTGPGHGLQSSAGRLIVPLKPLGTKQGNASRRVGTIYSDDHGATWKPGGIVNPSIGEMSESTAFERVDGSLVLNMRWHDGLYRAISMSTDGGLTWSDPKPDLDLQDPICQGSVIRYSNTGSDKRVLFSNLNHQKAGTAYRNRLTVKLSNDDGRSWPNSRQIVPGPSGYSDLAVTQSGGVLAFFERGTEIYSDKLTVVRMDMADFDQPEGEPPIGEPRYDIAMAKSFPEHAAWREQVHVKGNQQGGAVLHSFNTPLTTNTLLLYVYGVNQPGGLAYLQEIEVWGRETKK